jgi:D-serine deaminase-like pyridoxal phosphate-dependent protein
LDLNITKPTLLIDEKKSRANIRRMAEKANANGVELRPHFKTHQSLEIGRWFSQAGISKATVSSLDMADFFSSEWNDITVAFPLNILQIETVNKLASKIQLNLITDDAGTVGFLSKNLANKIRLFIEVNVGQNRSGVEAGDYDAIDQILSVISATDMIEYAGFLGHAGQSYQCRTKEEIEKVSAESRRIMQRLKEKYRATYPDLIISLGDTPCCSVAENFEGQDEMRPGNFVFYDLTQVQIGSCSLDQIAVALACPIVSISYERFEITFHGGGVHLSKDRMEEDGQIIFGKIAKKTAEGWGDLIPNVYVKSLSQEHGIIVVPGDTIGDYRIGDLLYVLPVHSCMTANLMREYQTVDGSVLTN